MEEKNVSLGNILNEVSQAEEKIVSIDIENRQLPATKDASLGSETPNCLDTADLLSADQ